MQLHRLLADVNVRDTSRGITEEEARGEVDMIDMDIGIRRGQLVGRICVGEDGGKFAGGEGMRVARWFDPVGAGEDANGIGGNEGMGLPW